MLFALHCVPKTDLAWRKERVVWVCDSARNSLCASFLGSNMNADEKHMFNAKLIAEVRKHEFLWNITNKKYKATHSKEPTWRRIAELLGSTGEQEFIVHCASRKANSEKRP